MNTTLARLSEFVQCNDISLSWLQRRLTHGAVDDDSKVVCSLGFLAMEEISPCFWDSVPSCLFHQGHGHFVKALVSLKLNPNQNKILVLSNELI